MKKEGSLFVPFQLVKMFKLHPQNRAIDTKHVAEIKKMMRESPTTIPAICVNTLTKVIIDGQHRWMAYQQLVNEGTWPSDAMLEVKFVNIPVEDELKRIIEAQKGNKTWHLDDYVQAHANGGVVSYIKLEEWTKSHELTFCSGKPKYRYAIIMMTGSEKAQAVKDGKLVITDEDLALGEIVHNELYQLTEALNCSRAGLSFEAMTSKWFKVRSNHPFKTWLQYIKKHKRLNYKKNKTSYADWNDYFNEVNTELYTQENAKKAS